MRRASLFVLIAATGCGTVAPVPDDVFLRLSLPVVAPEVSTAGWTKGEVWVAPVKASGLYHERAVAYSTDQGSSLRQHRYLFWLDSPGELIQATLRDFLRANRVAPQVVEKSSPVVTLEVETTLDKFEQHIAPSENVMQVQLSFAIRDHLTARSLFSRTYTAAETSTDSPTEIAAAMGRGTAHVYALFVRDASAALQLHKSQE
jgi:ABC-type uncharacterized transport system auxiliary subunit